MLLCSSFVLFGKMSMSFVHFLNRFFLMWNFEYSLYSSTSIRYRVCKYFLPVWCLAFHPLTDTFQEQKLFFFNLGEVQCIDFPFMDCVFSVKSNMFFA